MKPILAVGWDVGGWHGAKHAVAVASSDGYELHWRGNSSLFSLDGLRRLGGSALDLIRNAWPDAPDNTLEQWRVVIAIDAPLGFPQLFTQVLVSEDIPEFETTSFYDNPLAFRYTERWLYLNFGKRPLSAPFDKLGNNAITAILHARQWVKRHGFQLAPQHGQVPTGHAIIEVYPALVKRSDMPTRDCHERFARLLPEVVPGTDQFDAAICAVLAAAYGTGTPEAGSLLPPLIHPPTDVPQPILETEGWIYAVPTEWLTSS